MRKTKGYYSALFDAITKAQKLLDEANVTTYPIDLLVLARQKNIARIRELDIKMDGQLLELATGDYEVIIRKHSSPTKKRFTLAHEIAHVLLSTPRNTAESQFSCLPGSEIEELCDAIASELLVPSRFLSRIFTTPAEVRVESFWNISKSFDCSLEAGAWKLLNIGLTRGVLLIWTLRRRNRGLVFELISIPRSWQLAAPFKKGTIVDRGSELGKKLAPDGVDVIEFRADSNRTLWKAERIRKGRTVLVLVTMDRGRDRSEARPSAPQNVPAQAKLF